MGIRSFLLAPDFVFGGESGEEWLSDSAEDAMIIAVQVFPGREKRVSRIEGR